VFNWLSDVLSANCEYAKLDTRSNIIVKTMKICFIKGKVRVKPITAILTNDLTAILLPKEKTKYVSRWFSM
jgi:hypothetical protein